jgi:hypothetical protein
VEVICGERRGDRRYRVDLKLRYSFRVGNGAWQSGFGTVRDMSRGGILLAADRELPSGAAVELVIRWPFRLQGVCPLELVMEGEVVRVQGARAAIRSSRYQFRSSVFDYTQGDEGERERLTAIG